MKRTLSDLNLRYFENSRMGTFELFGVKINEIPVKPALITQVSRIKLSRCHLKEIPKGLKAYTLLKLVDLSENDFTEISSETLADFSLIQYLDFSINDIHYITPNLPPSIVHLDLSFNTNLDISSVFSLNLPSLEVIKLTYCNIKEFPDTNPTWSGTIKSLSLDGNELTGIPKFIQYCKQVDELVLLGNNISELNLDEKLEIKTLNLMMNPLEKSPDYEKLDVQILHLSHCQIRSFPPTQKITENLRVVTLANTGITGTLDVVIPEQLAYIDVSYNHIEALSPEFVASCGLASVINLSHNAIESIPDCFPEELSFSQILLSYNNLKELPPSMMSSKPLERFIVSHNKLEKIPDFKFPQLREFDVSFNTLKALPDSFSLCSFLVTVNVSYNKLTDLPESISQSRRILDLLASHNEFVVLPRAILGLASLRLLVLSMNHLTSLSSALGAFFFLRTLDLSNNNFVSIPKEISTLRALRNLSLSHNLIEKVDANTQLPSSLTNLDLSFNNIEEFDSSSLTSLTALSISCNKIKERDISDNCALIYYSDFANCIEEDETEYDGLNSIKILEMFNNPLEPPPVDEELGPHTMLPTFNNTWNYGYASNIGPRPTMEDVVAISSNTPNDVMVSLFDGHAGFGAAKNAGEFMKEEYQSIYDKEDDAIPPLVVQAFRNVEKKLYDKDVIGGCTCAFSMIHNKTVFAASIGDSRIIRVKKGSHERITTDHKPWAFEEFQRLKKAKLGVTPDKRIKRKLAVARALGDFWCTNFEGLFVDPEVNSFNIDEDDIGIVVACDGLWDVLDDEYVAEIVRDSKTAEDAATTLRNCCIALATTDNVSVAVVKFNEGGFDARNTVERIPIAPEPHLDPVAPSNDSAKSRRSSRTRR